MGLAVAVAALLLAGMFALLGREEPTPAPGGTERKIFPAGTATPEGLQPGLMLWNQGGPVWTPVAGQHAEFYEYYMRDIQTDIADAVDTAKLQTRIQDNWVNGVGTILGNSLYRDSWAAKQIDIGDWSNGVPYVTWNTGPAGTCYQNDIAPAYGNATFTTWYNDHVGAVLDMCEAEPGCLGMSLGLGVDGEIVTVRENTGCPDAQNLFDLVVSPSTYETWVKQALVHARTHSTKLLIAAPVSLSATYWFPRAIKTIMDYADTNDLYITFKNWGWTYTDHEFATAYGANYLTWGVCETAQKWSDGGLGGAILQSTLRRSAEEASLEGTALGQQTFMYYAGYGVLHCRAVLWEMFPEFPEDIISSELYAITRTIGLDIADRPAVLVVLRSQENPHYEWGATGMGGVAGEFEVGLSIAGAATPVPTRYCNPTAIPNATVVADPAVKGEELLCAKTASTWNEPQDWNYLGYAGGTTIGFAVEAGWVVSMTGNILIDYQNDATGTFTVTWTTAGGDQTEVVNKTGTAGNWTQAVIPVVGAVMDNSLATGGSVEIEADGTGIKLSRVMLDDNPAAESTPTPGPTRTPSATPTFTNTPTVTPTPSATPTRTVTPTPSQTLTLTPSRTWTPAPTATGNTPTNTPTAVATWALPCSGGRCPDEVGYVQTTELRLLDPDANFSSQTFHYIRWDNSAGGAAPQQAAMLMQFPNLAKPASSWVVSAELSLTVTSAGAVGPYAVDLYRMDRSWNVITATWNTAGTALWDVPGAFGIADRGVYSTYDGVTMADTTTYTDFGIDVTTDVQAWLDNGVTNNGWGLYLTAGPDCASCGSDRWLQLGGAHIYDKDDAPRLTITFGAAITPTVTPTFTASPTPYDTPTPTPTGTWTTPTPANTPTGTPTVTPTAMPGLKLNEVCPDPDADYNLDGATNWGDIAIELYNPGAAAIDLRWYQLLIENNLGVQQRYQFPTFALIDAADYKVVYADQLTDTAGATIQPGDGSTGTTLQLLSIYGTVLDQVIYSWPGDGLCYARFPNGGPAWATSRVPTLGEVN